jgi:Zinc finger, C2H2 type
LEQSNHHNRDAAGAAVENLCQSTTPSEILKEQPAPLFKPDDPAPFEIDEDVPLLFYLKRKRNQVQSSNQQLEETFSYEQTPERDQLQPNQLEQTPNFKKTPDFEQTPRRRAQPRIVCFQCTLCDTVFDDRSKCLMHLRNEHEEDVFPCRIDDCSMCYSNPFELSRHQWFSHRGSMKYHACRKGASIVVPPAPQTGRHSPDDGFFCHICRKVYKLKSYLLKHMRKMHVPRTGSTRQFQCAHCTLSYSKKWRLEKHLLLAHLKVAPSTRRVEPEYFGNECPFCHQSFKRLTSHIKNSHPKGNFRWTGRCKVERKIVSADDPAALDVKIFFCHICKKVFARRKYLTRHMRRMHLPKAPAPEVRLNIMLFILHIHKSIC